MRIRVTVAVAFALMLVAGSALAVTGDIGKVLSGPTGNLIHLVESDVLEYSGVVNLSALGNTVQSGYVILGDAGGNPADSTLWSDVIIITSPGHKPTNTAGDAADKVVIVSDDVSLVTGVTDAKLAALGGLGLPVVTCADIRASLAAGWATRIFETNTGITSYRPADNSILYYVYSDSALVPAAGPSALMILFFALAAAGAILIWRRGRTQPERA